ncbi:MAG: chitobiase/beta-hexosaminidase C-terminal domain-containing protein [Chitinophagaceae bacterium]|nr:chitobiase/beta-hexosaminidase C-terminal domain-containing protein [Chitinophagaceae bacterium]
MQRQKNIVFNISLSLNCLLLFLLFFDSRLSVPSWLQVFGRMHPLLVHFPIVIILVYFGCVFLITKKFQQEKWYGNMMDIILLLSSVTAVLSALMGLFLSKEAGYDLDALAIHKWTGAFTSFGLFLIYAFKSGIRRMPLLNYILAFGICLIVVLAGHFGGNITHGENYLLAPVTPEKKRVIAAFEDAIVYKDMVEPILESKCMSCHNSNKAKGELIMETKELLLKGGKEGKLWDSTKADLGLMMERIHLPENEKKHMPPAGKPQLTNEEIVVLYSWIKSGADFEKKVADLLPTDTLHAIALKTLKQSTDEQYDFAAADDKEIQKLSNNNRVITPLFLNSPALAVNFYNKQFYDSKQLAELKPLSNQVVELNLDNMPVKDEDLKIIGSFTNLRKLNLNGTAITGATLNELQKIPNLKSVSLSGTAVKAEQLNVLAGLPKLRTVYLWNTAIATQEIEKLAEKNKNIIYQAGFKGDTVVLKLTPPIIENEGSIITEAVPLRLKHYINGTILRYTMDGSDPDSINSPVYNDKVKLNSAAIVKAKAYKPGWISSDIAEQQFFKSTYHPDSIVMVTPVDPQYKAEGAKTIFDLRKSELNYKNGEWVGYRQNAMEVKMLFNKPIEANNVTMSIMKDADGYILPPLSMEVWGGTDENNLKLLARVTPKQPGKDSHEQENLAIACDFQPTQVTCIKLIAKPVPRLPDWHRGKGEKAWIFVDEVFVN